jgi:glutamate 5-kinase
MRTQLISKARRIVVKIGSNVLTDADGRVNEKTIEELARQVADLCRSGKEIILVTSGAISTGMVRMGLSKRPSALPQLQAVAAVGQSHLMNLYARQFGAQGLEVAQILLTADDLKVRQRHLNARNTIIALLERKIVPIINENDTVSTEEIKFGDNDALSALVLNLVKADLLIILTDIEGLMTRDPKRGGGELIREVRCISPEIEALARGVGSARGTGGMASKLKAVKMVTSSGETAIIADGRERDTLDKLFAGEEVGTLFHPGSGKLGGRKRWIAFFIKPKGEIVVDDGAAKALLDRGKSLLPTGVRDVVGDFKGGDKVSIVTLAGREIARGLTNYSAEDLRRIKGLKTGAIHGVLGHKDYDEVVHRDNLVLVAEADRIQNPGARIQNSGF